MANSPICLNIGCESILFIVIYKANFSNRSDFERVDHFESSSPSSSLPPYFQTRTMETIEMPEIPLTGDITSELDPTTK